MRYSARIVTFGLVLLAAACDSPTSAPTLAPPEAAQTDLQVVSRSMAMGMKDPAARLAVRDALRDSPWNEHKLGFQEFLGTEAGGVLLNAAARAGGESPAELRARVGRLPEMELYVPSRDQRLSWRGNGEVAVAATLDLDAARIDGFGADGRSITDALSFPADAVLLLAPAEFRTHRIDPQPRGVGQAIQSPEDGEVAQSVFTWTDAQGNTTTVNYEDVIAGRDPRFEPLTNHTSNTDTRLESIAGFMNDPGDLELAVKARFYAPDGTQLGYMTWKTAGAPKNTTIYPRFSLFSHVIPDNGNARVNIDVWELDDVSTCGDFCGDDDSYGTRDFYWYDRDLTQTVYCPSGKSVCSAGTSVANVKLHWHARSASVFTGVQVTASGIYVGNSGTATAKAVDQYGYGLSGYSVSSWSVADPSVAYITSSNGTSAYYYGASAGYNTISATINGVTGSAGFYVEEYWPPCDPNNPWQPC